jgi:hypothetical protein
MGGDPPRPEGFFSDYLPRQFALVRAHAAGKSSVGSLLFRVPEAGEWSLRLSDGELEVARGMEDDVMLQVTVALADFDVLVVEPVERIIAAGGTAGPRGGSLRALLADAETARLVRHVPGSVLFVVKDVDDSRRMLVTPGRRPAEMDKAACTISCAIDDFFAAQSGAIPPMTLFAQGKLRVTGNVQIALALSAVFT